MKNINPRHTSSWNQLISHQKEISKISLRTLFKDQPKRFNDYSLELNGLFVDFSKNIINQETKTLLVNLAKEMNLQQEIHKKFNGEKINETENRAVLHTALRDVDKINSSDEKIYTLIKSSHLKMKAFSEQIISGQHKGFTGKPIKHIVNIGIGGSDLGPSMVIEALRSYRNHLNTSFISNLDGTQAEKVIKKLDPETTLFIVASKSFTTDETMTNAKTVKNWFLKTLPFEAIEKHFIAISTNLECATEFGIKKENVFEFWDWVGGRYSLWSPIGLSIVLAIGFENFEKLLLGAHQMDNHFKETPFDKNIPATLALLGIWYNNFFGYESHGIFPYDKNLSKLNPHLQQVIMESNGKSIDKDGNKVDYQTGEIIWGTPGTNGQHAYFQLLHQGTKVIPCDFLAPISPSYQLPNHHEKMLANCLAQSRALAFGKNKEEVETELKDNGLSDCEIKKLIPYKVFEGNRPSNTLLYKELSPEILGMILAMYEHKTFVQGVIWNIYSFDQWGVELGKVLCKEILPEVLKEDSTTNEFDSSTNGLINLIKKS